MNLAPRIYVRDLLWLVLTICLALGWWTERSRLTAELSEEIHRRQKVDQRFAQLRSDLDTGRVISTELQQAIESVYHHELPGTPGAIEHLHAVVDKADQLLAQHRLLDESVNAGETSTLD